MSVSVYKNNECKYSIDKLEKVVYLINEEALRNIHIDDGEAYITDIDQEPMSLSVYDIELLDADELDERYKFTHTLKFSMNGYVNYRDFEGRYYAIVKTVDGEYWLVNPLFPCKVTYTYTLDSNDSHTDFTLATISNHPTLRIHGMEHATPYECGYRRCTFKSLRLNETIYSLVTGNHVLYTNDGFKDIEYNKNSAVFTETFDGNNVQHKLDFNIKFDNYKDSWHYNLLEFTENRYAAIIETSCNKFILTGFHFGLQPSFNVTANDDMTMDNIQISLVDMHDNGWFLSYQDEITVEKDGTTRWMYTTKYDGYECIGDGVARYLLKEEVDALMNPTGNYMCLVGYEERFTSQGLNIVDTFDETDTFESYECSSNCKMQSSFPFEFIFNNESCREYGLICDSDWTITSSSEHITVSPSSGAAKESYVVEVCNTLEPSDELVTSYLLLNYCNKSKTLKVTVKNGDDCFSAGAVFDISANGQYVTIPTQCCVSTVVDTGGTITNITIQNAYIKVYVPENLTSNPRQFRLTVTFCDGHTAIVIINQGIGFERWIKEDEVCVGNQKCDIERKYTGITASEINTRTEDIRTVNCAASSDCSSVTTRWIDSTETTCNGGRKYVVQVEQVSNDGGQIWELTGNKRLGAETSDSPAECEGTENYTKWEVEGYICEGTTKYARERLYTSTDNTNWIATDTYRRSDTVLETDSADCGYVHPSDTWKCEKWEIDDGYICEGTTKYAREQRYVRDCNDCNNCEAEWIATGIYRRTNTVLESNSSDCGYVKPSTAWTCSKWEVVDDDYICEDGTKYTKERRYVRECEDCSDCSAPWIPTDVYRRGSTVLEENSTDCGYDPTVTGNCTEYRDDGDTICDGFDKYKYLRKYVRECENCNDCSASWVATNIYKRGTLIQTNSVDCGYIPTDTYERWVEDGYMCDGYSKYKRLRREISDDNVQWYQTNTYKRGSLIENESFDCGYIPTDTFYDWRVEGTMCNGFNKYNRERKYISDDGNRWYATDIYRQGSLIESNSSDCGYVPSIEYEYQWVLTTMTTCIVYDKYFLYKRQKRIKNSGASWEDVIPTQTSYNGEGTMTPQLIEADSTDCGYTPPIDPKYKWVLLDESEYICDECGGIEYRYVAVNDYCVGYDKWEHQKRQYSLDSGATWSDTVPEQTKEVLIEEDSRDCGYANYKLFKTSNSSSHILECDDSPILTQDEVSIGFGGAYIKTFRIGNCVTNIDTNAFSYCYNATSCTIGNSVTTIGNGSFRDCRSLTSITIPNSVTTIEANAFYHCIGLTRIDIPDSVTSIGNGSFFDCEGLTSCTIGSGVTTIEANAFYHCIGLTRIDIPDNVTIIGESAFMNCRSLKSCTIGNGVTSIGDEAFYYCRSLTSCTIGSGVTSIGYRNFAECSLLTSINIPSGVTSIGDGAFYSCSRLTSITIPNVVTNIGSYAFYGCRSLTNIDIPDSVASIGWEAFRGCSSLTSCTIGSGVTSIGDRGLYECNSLESITVLATTPPSCGQDFLSYTDTLNAIYVPADSVAAYKYAARWGGFSSKIQPIP